ncbi:MAG: hypothetical protein WC662_04370 [Candidatus Paceibacterota bacterium]|jgi:hypothetical protein
MKKFLEEAKKLAYEEQEKTGMPVKQHVDLSTETGKKIAKELGANIEIVEAGTLLMDCLIGQALEENRLNDHVQMSLEKTNELLKKYNFSEQDKENIRHCVSEHHGVPKFYSLESEICCNADCYRFVSLKGFFSYIKYGRDMSFEDLIILLKKKAEEKWNALSLDICKKELENEHKLILEVLKNLK